MSFEPSSQPQLLFYHRGGRDTKFLPSGWWLEVISSLFGCVCRWKNTHKMMQLSCALVAMISYCRCCFPSAGGWGVKDWASCAPGGELRGTGIYGQRELHVKGHRSLCYLIFSMEISSLPQSTGPIATQMVFLGCTLCSGPAHLLQKMEGVADDVKSIPEWQPSGIIVGNWILLLSSLYSFVRDAVGDGASSSFIGMGRRAKTGGFCASVVPAICLDYR